MKIRVCLVATIVAYLTVLLFPLDAEARRGRRVQIDFQEDWIGENEIDFTLDENSDVKRFVDNDEDGIADPNSELPLRLNIGGIFYDRLWINENGFVSLGTSSLLNPTTYDPAATSIDDVVGVVFSPFYSDLDARVPTPGCPQGTDPSEPCDVSFAFLNIPTDEFDDPENDFDVDYQRALRVTWGTYPLGGVGIAQAGNPNNTIRFQMMIIDRSPGAQSAVTFAHGDFDLWFYYDVVTWQRINPVVGVLSPSSTVDFTDFYTSFLGNNDDEDAGYQCAGLPAVDFSFDPGIPWPCSYVNIKFRDGEPVLATYTADLSVELSTRPNIVNAADEFFADVSISNGDLDDETNSIATLELPLGVRFVDVTPASVSCNRAASVLELSCEAGQIVANSTNNFSVQLVPTLPGQTPLRVHVSGNLFDPDADVGNSGNALLTAKGGASPPPKPPSSSAVGDEDASVDTKFGLEEESDRHSATLDEEFPSTSGGGGSTGYATVLYLLFALIARLHRRRLAGARTSYV